MVLALPLDEPSRRFALAVYYAGLRLRGEALMVLDGIGDDLDAATVHLWRGDLLTAMQLPLEAESAYNDALAAAQAVGDREAEAASQAGLWRVTGDGARCEAAVTAYEALGDQAQADQLWKEGCP